MPSRMHKDNFNYTSPFGGSLYVWLCDVSNPNRSRAIAQEVSRRLPTAASHVLAQVKSCGICGGQSVTGADFLQALRFPLPIVLHTHHHHLPSWAGTISQIVADVPSGLSLTPPKETKKKKKLTEYASANSEVVLGQCKRLGTANATFHCIFSPQVSVIPVRTR
jgi:hypothetical protein